MDWAVKFVLKGRRVEDYPLERSPYHETKKDIKIRALRDIRARKYFPQVLKIIEEKLSDRQRDAIMFFYGLTSNVSRKELGDMMNIDRSGASRHIKRGIISIRRHLKVEVF